MTSTMNNNNIFPVLLCIFFATSYLGSISGLSYPPVQDNTRLPESWSRLSHRGHCLGELWNLRSAQPRPVNPPKLSGHWVSTRCEIGVGPTYRVRAFNFLETGSFYTYRYEYKDPDCTQPIRGIYAEGRIGKHLLKARTVPGAWKAAYQIQKVDIVPYTSEEVGRTKKLLDQCTNKSPGSSQEQSERDNSTASPTGFDSVQRHAPTTIFEQSKSSLNIVFNSVILEPYGADETPSKSDGLNCLNDFALTFDDLQIIQQVDANSPTQDIDSATFPFGHHRQQHVVRQLLLGKSLWSSERGVSLRPSSFDVPLVNGYDVSKCKTCNRIRDSSIVTPPILSIERRRVSIDSTFTELDGHWLSTACESRPHGNFALRHLHFRPSKRVWTMRQTFFDDPDCNHASLTLIFKGKISRFTGVPSIGKEHYPKRRQSSPKRNIHAAGLPNLPDKPKVARRKSYQVENSTPVFYRVQKLKIIPNNMRMVRNLQFAPNCGGPAARFRLNKSTDVSHNGGCAYFGLPMPVVSSELLLLEENKLTKSQQRQQKQHRRIRQNSQRQQQQQQQQQQRHGSHIITDDTLLNLISNSNSAQQRLFVGDHEDGLLFRMPPGKLPSAFGAPLKRCEPPTIVVNFADNTDSSKAPLSPWTPRVKLGNSDLNRYVSELKSSSLPTRTINGFGANCLNFVTVLLTLAQFIFTSSSV